MVTEWVVRLENPDEEDVVREGDLRNLLDQIVDVVDKAETLGPSLLWELAIEASAILTSSARSPSLLRHDLELTLRGRVSAEELSATLLPPPKEYMVLLGVNGTRDLLAFPRSSKFRRLRSGAKQGLSEWGKAGLTAHAFMSRFGVEGGLTKWNDKTVGPSLFYFAEVAAIDAGAAAESARSLFSPVLDRYVAAHPSVKLALFDVALVGLPEETETHQHLFGPPRSRSVAPLPFQPRPGLEPGMLMNAVARNSATPLARVAFSWAALESAGITAALSQRVEASKALALLELRQMNHITYLDAVRGARARREIADRYVAISDRAQTKLRRLSSQAISAPASRLEILNRGIRRAGVRAAAATRLSTIHFKIAEGQIALLEQLEVAQTGSRHGDPDFAILKHFDKWWAHLSDLAKNEAGPGRSDLSSLLRLSGADTSVRVSAFANTVVDPIGTGKFLRARQRHFLATLNAMYAARNMYFHAGQTEMPGALALGRAAPSIADALLELWLLWDSSAREMSSLDVLNRLGQRYDVVLGALAGGGDESLNHLGSLTAPVWR